MNSSSLFHILSFYLRWIIIIGTILTVASDAITIYLNPQYNPISESISDLILYPHGWIIKIGISVMVVIHTLLAMTILSSPASRHHCAIKLAGIIFTIIGFGLITVIVFNTDPGKGIISLAGGIHIATAIIISFLFPIACGLLTIALWHHRKSESLIIFSAIVAVVSLVIAYLTMPHNDFGAFGVCERLLAFTNISWLVMAGFRLPRLLSA
jgi:hypothetical protein